MPSTIPMNEARCEDAAVAVLRSAAYMLTERHGDGCTEVDRLLIMADDIEQGFPNEALETLEQWARPGEPNRFPSKRDALRSVARTVLLLLNGCDW